MTGRPKWFAIEGNIGSGKSTLCKLLERDLVDSQVFYEPVDMWKEMTEDSSGKNLLEFYYENQKRWGFTFQLYGLFTMMENNKKGTDKKIKFVERSLDSFKNVFARSLYERGMMTDLEWKMYNQWYECLVKETFEDINMPDGYIYIRADPETSYQRMLKRERTEEKCVPKEYLETINRYHDEWLKTIDSKKVLIIDVDKDFEHTPEEWERILSLISDFIQS